MDGVSGIRRRVMADIAERIGANDVDDVGELLLEMVNRGRRRNLTDEEVMELDQLIDMLQRLEALDSAWVFGHRYMGHKFVSTDPVCPKCNNEVPHRTILVCPSCGEMGPWVQLERHIQSSYLHYYLVEQATRLVNNSLLMPDGAYRADGTVTAVPRGGAKSTWLCEIMGTWLVLTDRSRCLLLLSNTIEQVTERCNEIKTELEENESIIRDFGQLSASRMENRTWTKSDFVLPNGNRVVSRGAMQSMRGVKNRENRPDVVIADDSDDEKFLTTPEQARKVHEWWDSRVVPACHPNALFMFHGTVISEMGLLWQMLSGHRGRTFRQHVFRAVEDRAGCASCGMPAPTVGRFDCPVCAKKTRAVRPSSYWGARFTAEALEVTKARVGHWAWQTEFQQEPHDDSASWFQREWLDRARRDDLAPLPRSSRRIIPWSAIACTLTGSEAVELATMADSKYAKVPGDLGPYQVIVQSWDPAWARAKKKGQERDHATAYMAGVGIGLTWDDTFDVFWLDRGRNLPGNSAYREWMYEEWVRSILPSGSIERPGQLGMIVERNSAGVLFQYGVEEHWGSIPMIDHQTGAEKHDLTDGIPGMASTLKEGRMIIRAGGSDEQRELADELIYEIRHSGRSRYKDMLMALWFGWAYIQRWVRDVRDPARYEELVRRRSPLQRRTTH
jgi:hypothetical protein